MNKKIAIGFLTMLLLFCSIGNAADFRNIYNSGVSNDVDYEQLEKIQDAQRHFNLIKQTNDYYAILMFDQEIKQKAEEEILSWSDLEVQDEIEYSLIICDARQRAARAAWQSLHEDENMSIADKSMCVEIICSAVEKGDLDWEKDLDGINEITLREIVERDFDF